jgi:UDP-N-acetylglucosamine 4,6-dehydratase
MTRFSITLEQGVNFVIERLENMWGGELFVPKIPSYKILDVAAAIAPKCKINYIGLRPGEKMHEQLIGEADAQYTVESKNYYTVYSPYHFLNKSFLNKCKI